MFTIAVVTVGEALTIGDGGGNCVGSRAKSIRVGKAVLKLDPVLIPVSSQNRLDLFQERRKKRDNSSMLSRMIMLVSADQ